MAVKELKSIKFPGLDDVYVIPEGVQIDSTLSVSGKAADAKSVGNALETKQPVGDYALKSEIPSINAFSNIKVGNTTIAADTVADTLELVGSNVTITPDATNDKVTIGITKSDVTTALGYTPPTTDTKYTHPTTSGNKHIPAGGSDGQILRWSADGTAEWGNDSGGNSANSNVTLLTSGWNSENEQTVSVSGVTSTNNIFVGSDLGSEPMYSDCGVYCSSQGEGTLTFKCSTIPSEDVIANAVIL